MRPEFSKHRNEKSNCAILDFTYFLFALFEKTHSNYSYIYIEIYIELREWNITILTSDTEIL
jgi:hypothetical protein